MAIAQVQDPRGLIRAGPPGRGIVVGVVGLYAVDAEGRRFGDQLFGRSPVADGMGKNRDSPRLVDCLNDLSCFGVFCLGWLTAQVGAHDRMIWVEGVGQDVHFVVDQPTVNFHADPQFGYWLAGVIPLPVLEPAPSGVVATDAVVVGDGEAFEPDVDGLLHEHLRLEPPIGVNRVHVKVVGAWAALGIDGFEGPFERSSPETL